MMIRLFIIKWFLKETATFESGLSAMSSVVQDLGKDNKQILEMHKFFLPLYAQFLSIELIQLSI